MFPRFSISRSSLICSALAAISMVYGCSKKDLQDAKPTAETAKQDAIQHLLAAGDTTGTAAWEKFVSSVEGGSQKDPIGQFVSKSTFVKDNPNGPRPTRPKGEKAAQMRLALFPNRRGNGGFDGPILNNVAPFDPDNGGGGGPTQPPASPSSGFASSEGRQMGVNPIDNPNNYIFNLTIVKGDPPAFSNDKLLEPRAGYGMIPIDLNKGAGGKVIYLCYTRYNGDVAEAPKHDPAGGINRCINGIGPNASTDCYNNPDKLPITSLTATSESFIGTTNPTKWPGYDWIYNYTGVYPFYWKYPDLNDGAGGRYIYPEVTKGLRNTYPPLPTAPIKEVGVLYSTDDSTMPPAGWQKIYQDLNEGAGGYFIYFCYKN